MAQFDFATIDPDETSGDELAALLGNWRNALHSQHAGDGAPDYVTGGMVWIDDSDADFWIVNIYDGAASLPIGIIDTNNHAWLPYVGGGLGTVASAATCDLWSVPESYVTITGSTGPITVLAGGAAIAGTEKIAILASTPTLTHDGTQLILPGGKNIAGKAGDRLRVVALGSGNVEVVDYIRANGKAVVETPGELSVQTKTGDYTFGRTTDVGGLVRFNKATGGTFTVPPKDSTNDWVTGDRIDFSQVGAGQLTIAQGSGVTVNGNKKTANQWAAGSIVCIDASTDIWDCYGAMTS